MVASEMIHELKRKKMIERLHSMGIKDIRVLQAMQTVHRHKFVPSGFESQAYEEKALPIGFGQTISHPYTVALMTETIRIKKNDKILEIGTGSGYQSAVLCELGAQVFTVEIEPSLAKSAERILKELNYLFSIRQGDGSMGWQSYAPYDAIIVTAGAPITPENLISQLKPSSRLVIPIGSADEQILTLYIKEASEIKIINIKRLRFVPLKGVHGW